MTHIKLLRRMHKQPECQASQDILDQIVPCILELADKLYELEDRLTMHFHPQKESESGISSESALDICRQIRADDPGESPTGDYFELLKRVNRLEK